MTACPHPPDSARVRLTALDAHIIALVWWARGGRPWTMRDLADELGIRSISTVSYHLRRCTEWGWLRWLAMVPAHGRYGIYVPGPRLAGLDSDGWPLEELPRREWGTTVVCETPIQVSRPRRDFRRALERASRAAAPPKGGWA